MRGVVVGVVLWSQAVWAQECVNPAACTELAQKLVDGHTQKRDLRKASALLTRACEQKEPRACNLLGQLYTEARGVRRDRKRGATLFQKACDAGLGEGCANLAWALYRDEGVAGEDVIEAGHKAVGLLRKACDGGSADACAVAGALLDSGPGRQAPDKSAIELLQKACDGGSAAGCMRLGQRLIGTGAEASSGGPARGVALLRKSCDLGLYDACIAAGTAFGKGAAGVKRDEAVADTMFRRALSAHEKDCDAGLAEACVALGVMYEAGQGVDRSAVTAMGYYKTACEGGEAAGCRHVGDILQAAQAGRDALRWWRRACDGSDATGCERMSSWYGTDNPKEAARWHLRSCEIDKAACAPRLTNDR